MPGTSATTKKARWGEEVGDELGDEFPSSTTIGPDEFGIKTVIEKYIDEDGKKVQVTRKIQVKKIQETVNKTVAQRKHWKKFGDAKGTPDGPDPSTTNVSENIVFKLSLKSTVPAEKEEESNTSLDALKKKDKMVVCRICKGDHWTLKCPYKDTLGALSDALPTTEAEPEAKPETKPASSEKSNVYIPPSLRGGGDPTKRRVSEAPSRRSNDDNTIRVTNLSEDTRETDLQELFRRFGSITRVFLVKDKNTGASKGFAFVSFANRDDAQRAITAVDGYGYDNLILHVEWARPSGDSA